MSNISFLSCPLAVMKKSLRFSLLAVLFCAAGLQLVEAATLSLAPGSSSLSIGDTVFVDLNVSGLTAGAAPSLGGFDITVDFPSIVTFDSATYGDPVLGADQLDLLSSGSITQTTPGLDNVQLLEVSFDSVATLNSLQPAAFTLAVLKFTADSAGSGNFSLANVTLSDASGAALGSSVSNTPIGVVGAVPEPSALLPLCGLLALGLLMRKRLAAFTGR